MPARLWLDPPKPTEAHLNRLLLHRAESEQPKLSSLIQLMSGSGFHSQLSRLKQMVLMVQGDKNLSLTGSIFKYNMHRPFWNQAHLFDEWTFLYQLDLNRLSVTTAYIYLAAYLETVC